MKSLKKSQGNKYKYYFSGSLIKGVLLKRYKRFLAEIELNTGEMVIAHCTNSGSMKSCYLPGAEVYLSKNNNPNRKTHFTWEMIKINSSWVGINTLLPNRIVYEAIQQNFIPELKDFSVLEKEVKFRESRFDIYGEKDHKKCFIEVKNVTYKEGEFALFPDAISTRGTKHLRNLMEARSIGYRAIMFYLVQRSDVKFFGPAIDIDETYAETLSKAVNSGIEVLAYRTKTYPSYIELDTRLPFVIKTSQ